MRPEQPTEGNRCAHCGQGSSMQGHHFMENNLVNGADFERLACPKTIQGEAPNRSAFACRPGHKCQ